MLAIAINALYTSLRRRGTTRQLAGAIVTCVVSALLLLPAIVWYNLRFSVESVNLSPAEVEVALVYVALWGWLLPLGVTTAYCLFTLPRTSTTSVHIPQPKRTTRINTATALNPPRHQPGFLAPYVYSENTPWAWLEYRNGNFQGQRLALTRSIITIGRGEESDIWLDDDMASRNHAELAWDKSIVYITDCNSLNGVLLNGKRIRGTAIIEPNDLLEIGSHRFLFAYAETSGTPGEQDDPLTRHVWHSVDALQTESEKLERLPTSQLPSDESHDSIPPDRRSVRQLPATLPSEMISELEAQDTAEIHQVASQPPSKTADMPVMLVVHDGEAAGQGFQLDRPVITLGRGSECDVVINDVSISRRHAQVLRQANGYFVQDLESRNGTTVNGEPLHEPRLLHIGDIICVGNIRLECMAYMTPLAEQNAQTMQNMQMVPSDPDTPMPQSVIPASSVRPINSGPMPLRLPSRPKQ
jgi:pSer/pThr/pTyr-binding forkhead associated (FHA) protein